MLKVRGERITVCRVLWPCVAAKFGTASPSSVFSGIAEPPVVFSLEVNGESVCEQRDRERQTIIDKLRTLLLSGKIEDAYKLNESLVLRSDSLFSSPSHIYSLFAVSCPSLSFTVLDMLLAISSVLKMVEEANKLYLLIRKDGKLPSAYSFKEFFTLLINNKNFGKVLELFDEMILSGCRPDQYIHGKAVEAAAKLGNIDKAKEVVDLMKKEGGVGSTVFVHNILISHLCKEGNVKDARKVFDDMVQLGLRPTIISYNSLIDGYCKIGEIGEALCLRCKMAVHRMEPNMITFNTLLRGLCKSGRMNEISKMLREMESSGFQPDAYSYSIIFDGFSKSGDMNGALSFYEILTQNGIQINHYTGTVLANGLCKSGNMEKAEEVLELLVKHGNANHVPVYNTIICGYCRSGDFDRAVLVLEKMERRGLRPDSISFNSLITWFCEQGKMEEANLWVNTMLEKGIKPTVETYNILIDGYGKLCMFTKCFHILEEMETYGMLPNVISYGSLINNLCKDGRVLEAETVLRDMSNRQVPSNTQVYNMLIHGSCTMGKTQDAFRFLDEMLKSGLEPTNVTCNLLVNGLCKTGRMKEAEDMFNVTGRKPDIVSYNTLISGYAKVEDAQKCLELYQALQSDGLKPTINTYHALIEGCRKEGIVLVEKLYCDLLSMNLSPDQVIYNGLIQCYAENGDAKMAMSFVKQSSEKNIPVNKKTYTSLILGCFKDGVTAEEGTIRQIVELMNNEARFEVEADTYNIVIKGYCLVKDFEKGYRWYKEMIKKKLIPNSNICKDLVDGLHQSGKVDEAINVSSHIYSCV